MKIIDPSGNVFRVYETFSDSVGTFKVDEFKIPEEASVGKWTVKISSGENLKEQQFIVAEEADGIVLSTPNSTVTHNAGDILEITGKHARVGASVFISILNSVGTSVDELTLVSNSDGEFYTIWMIPNDLESGTYEIIATDPNSTSSSSLIIN